LFQTIKQRSCFAIRPKLPLNPALSLSPGCQENNGIADEKFQVPYRDVAETQLRFGVFDTARPSLANLPNFGGPI
jgi:hypothetical protein